MGVPLDLELHELLDVIARQVNTEVFVSDHVHTRRVLYLNADGRPCRSENAVSAVAGREIYGRLRRLVEAVAG